MLKRNRMKLSSPESFVTAFNKHQHLYRNPKGEENPNPISMKLIGVDSDGKFKQERIHLLRWRVDALEIIFQSNRKVTINLGELKRQVREQQRKQKQKHKQQQSS